MSTWINFREVRKSLSFEAVLQHYGVTVKKTHSGNRHVGRCPLPQHTGKGKTPSFSAKLDIGVFQCFSCKAHGTILHFAALMEGLDPDNPMDLRTVALKLRDTFLSAPAESPKKDPAKKPPATLFNAGTSGSQQSVLVNPPMDFELKDLDAEHPYLKSRGFHLDTIRHFGLGFCSRGLMKGRVVIPLHDADGRLVGYAGRVVDDAAITDENPRYRLPGRRERDGRIIEFRKSLLLYNQHRLKHPVNDLLVVEGFASVWWLIQWGYPSVVALIDSDCSPEQARLIVQTTAPDGRVWVLPIPTMLVRSVRWLCWPRSRHTDGLGGSNRSNGSPPIVPLVISNACSPVCLLPERRWLMRAADYARICFDRYRFSGFHGCPSWCALEILRLDDGRFAVIATERPDNPGTSVTNAFELLAGDVCARFGIDPRKLVWIEHYGYPDGYSPTEPRNFHQVMFIVARAADGSWFYGARWRLMTDADWQRLGLAPRQPVCY